MDGKCHLFLFSCSARELGWSEAENVSDETREHVQHVLDSAVADMADRFSGEGSFTVTWFGGTDSLQATQSSLSSSVMLRSRTSSGLPADVGEAVREVYSHASSAPVIIFLGRNPLYPLDLIQKGADLLFQEDDVVVVGQGHDAVGNVWVMWLATKSYHPELFDANRMWWGEGGVFQQLTTMTESLIMPIRPVREDRTIEDLQTMLHDIEREILLKKWYPQRTYEALKRMQRMHILREVPE